MPGLDGFDVCRSLKGDAALASVPVVFVTRFADPRYEARALDLGAADFVAKPISPAVLHARVSNLLELKRRADAELRAVLSEKLPISCLRTQSIRCLPNRPGGWSTS